MKAFLILEDGTVFTGISIGSTKEIISEIVFNTSMVGYQEIVSDPSYTGQAVVMTYPLIGNYGMNDEDYETKVPSIGGLIVREYNDTPSNFRYTKTLSEVLEENNIPGIQGIDTRAVVGIIRREGAQKVMICSVDTPLWSALEKIKAYNPKPNEVERVSCKKIWFSRTPDHKYDVVGSLCENSDKFAIDRALPEIKIGDLLVIHDTGAHGHAMGYNYNGRLRSAEVLYTQEGGYKLIRRAETAQDYFATLDMDECAAKLGLTPKK